MEEEEPLRELQEVLSDLTSLKDSRGYKRLMMVAQGQVESRTNQLILAPLAGMDAVFAQEYAKGEIAGIRLFTEIVDDQIKVLEDEIQEKLKEQEKANADSNENPDGT
jgi:hypothetical protein